VVFEEWESQGADSEEPDPDKFTDPWDESYNVYLEHKGLAICRSTNKLESSYHHRHLYERGIQLGR
jgi:hypothetical protein